jgi:predicted unusual protein kinase regulating ubiquinone biosynthesis (AarF/ABC1/UbiB family)
MPVWLLILLCIAAFAGVAMASSRTARRFLWTMLVLGRVLVLRLFDALRDRPDLHPVRLREAFETLGPTYVKLAQLVASSEGMFPEPYCVEFRRCLDAVPSFSVHAVHRTLREDFGEERLKAFSEIEETPIASASIAQVHGATLSTGQRVVLKVQRPNLPALVAADLRVLRLLSGLIERVPFGNLANPSSIVDDFAANLAEELDFHHEAKNLDEFNELMKKHGFDGVAAPKPLHEHLSARILTMERFDGFRIDDTTQLAPIAHELEDKLLLGMRAWFRCLLVHGFFHGDVHAGNLMVLSDGRIGFLDFGIVGRFTPERRKLISDFMLAIATRNFRSLAQAMVEMGHMQGVDIDALGRGLEEGCAPLLEPGRAAKYADLLPIIMRVSLRHRMRLPRDFVLILKQMIYFDRYAKLLAPKLNIFNDPRIIASLMQDLALSRAAA